MSDSYTTEELVEDVNALAEEWYSTSGDYGEFSNHEANEEPTVAASRKAKED